MTPPTPAAPRSHANSRWRRHALRVALCLFAGFVITVGVAWGLAVWNPATFAHLQTAIGRGDFATWRWDAPEGARPCAVGLLKAQGVGRMTLYLTKDPIGWRGTPKPTAEFLAAELQAFNAMFPYWVSANDVCWRIEEWPKGEKIRLVDARGWPMLAMWTLTEMSQVQAAPNVNVSGGITLEMRSPSSGTLGLGQTVLPIRIIWPDLIVNTLFYAAIVFVCTFNYAALRRTLRRRKCLCEHCRYDLRATPRELPCPECGAPRSLK